MTGLSERRAWYPRRQVAQYEWRDDAGEMVAYWDGAMLSYWISDTRHGVYTSVSTVERARELLAGLNDGKVE